MNTSRQIPRTQNEAWGFWGSMSEQADAAWSIALPAIADATSAQFEVVQAFLDSRHGRHFADDVRDQIDSGCSLHGAVHAAIAIWMGWKIDRHAARDYGIPRSLPYLTGFVVHCGITTEMAG